MAAAHMIPGIVALGSRIVTIAAAEGVGAVLSLRNHLNTTGKAGHHRETLNQIERDPRQQKFGTHMESAGALALPIYIPTSLT